MLSYIACPKKCCRFKNMDTKKIKRKIGNIYASVVFVAALGWAVNYVWRECVGPEGAYFQWQVVKLLIFVCAFFLVIKLLDKIKMNSGNSFKIETVRGVAAASFLAAIFSLLGLFVPKAISESFGNSFGSIFIAAFIIVLIAPLIYFVFQLILAIYRTVEWMEKNGKT